MSEVKRIGLAILLVGGLMCGLSCRQKTVVKDAVARRSVVVSIPPQAWLVRRIAGDCVGVDVLIRPGQDPHTYEPTLKQMARLAEADAFFRIGVPFETRLLEQLADTLGGLNVVDTREGIRLREMSAGDHDHSRGQPDPHFWMNPQNMEIMAGTICEELKRIDPAGAKEYDRNLSLLRADLENLDREIAKKLAPLKGRAIFVYHPAFGYFTDRYSLEQRAVEIQGKSPRAKKLAELIATARSENVKVIFVQPQFSRRSADRVAKAIGGVVVPLDPLAEDYMSNLRRMAEKISRSLGSK